MSPASGTKTITEINKQNYEMIPMRIHSKRKNGNT